MFKEIQADKKLLTVEEAGHLIGIGKTKTYELVYAGKLPAIDLNEGLGGERPCWRIPRQALDKWIEQKTADALAWAQRNPGGGHRAPGRPQ